MRAATRRAFMAGSMALAATAAQGKTRGFARTQAFLQSYVDAGKLPGACVGIQPRRGAAIILGAGRIALSSDAPAMNARAIGRVFSMTKPVTALTALSLIDAGLLRLDQPIAEILPAYANPRVLVDAQTMETRPAVRPILVRHLMTHTAGLGYAIDRTSRSRRFIGRAASIPAPARPPRAKAPGRRACGRSQIASLRCRCNPIRAIATPTASASIYWLL